MIYERYSVTAKTTRNRGERAGLDARTIVKAARAIEPGRLTMKAVADAIGVDRKALNYHVESRDELMAMVAADAFSAEFTDFPISCDATWQESCRLFSLGLVASLDRMGMLAEHFRVGHSCTSGFLRPGEIVLARLVAAGFESEDAARLLLLLSNMTISYARDKAMEAQGGRALAQRVRTELAACEKGGLPVTSNLLERGVDIASERQLQLGIDIFLRGAEHRLQDALKSGGT